MDHPIIIEGEDLTYLLALLRGGWEPVNTLRVVQTSNGAKFKVNGGTWTPALGRREK